MSELDDWLKAPGSSSSVADIERSLTPQELELVKYHRNTIKTNTVGRDPQGRPVTVYSNTIEVPDGPYQGQYVTVPGYFEGQLHEDETELLNKWKGEIDAGKWPTYANPEQADARAKHIHGIMDIEGDGSPALESDLTQWLKQDDAKLNLSVQEGVTRDPARATRILQLQTRTGLPKDFIDQNLDFVEQQAARQDFNPDLFKRRSRSLAAWIAEHPDHAAAVKEDLSKLSYVERQYRYVSGQYERGNLTVELADLGAKAMDGTITPQERQRQAFLEKAMGEQDNTDITGFFEQIPGQVAQQIPIQLRSMKGKVEAAGEGTVIGAAAGAAAGAATANPALPAIGATLGAVSGWRYGAAIEAGKLEMRLAYLDYEKLKDENGQPLDKNTILGLSGIVGVINGALEGLTGIERATNQLPWIRNFTRSGIKDLLASPSARAAVLSYAKTVGAVMAEEGITEGLQSMVTNAGKVIAKATGGPTDILGELFSPENLNQAVQEARAGAQGGGGMGAAIAAPSLLADIHAAKQAKETQQVFLDIGKATQATKMSETLPEHLQAIISAATKEGPIETVYVPTESFNTYFQSKGVDPRQVAEAITGSVEAYDQAMATGHDLPIRTADYATKIAGTEHNAFFANELRTSVDAMNAREADEWQKMMDDHQAAAVQQQGLMTANVTDAAAKVRQDIAGQLQAAGFDPHVADQYAALYEARYRARAERRGLGEDPFELFQRLNLHVTKQLPDILRTLGEQQTELDALLNRLRVGDVPKPQEVFGQSLRQFLIDKGGLKDEGGELAALDVDAARKPFEKKLVQKEGLSLDKAAELAAEAGYLPERDLAQLIDALGTETRGTPVYAIGRENARLLDVQNNLESLQQWLADRGINLQTQSNEEIKALLGEAVQQSLPTVEGETFAQGDITIRKGQITFGDNQINIKLLEKADLSSFLHETGHLYLNELIDDATTEGVPQTLKDDLDSILKWMGLEVTVASGRDAIRSAVQTQQHEQWARGFENYLLEGKAPNQSLREAFARFRQWLIHVYRLFRGGVDDAGKVLDVQLTKEVREVMDRMIATDDEIDAAAAEAEVHPLFTDAVKAGMSDAQWANYQELVGKASRTAREQLQAKLMAQFQRQKETWWKERREKVLKDVTDEVNQQPEYVALAVLQKGKMPDGSDLPDGIEPMKLDKKGLADQFGKDFLKRLPRGTTAAKEGMHQDTAAQLFGYTNAQDFIMALVNARPKQQLIEAETDRRMAEEYGDMRFDGTLAEAARVAVLNEYQEQVIEAELKALNRKRREVMPFVKAALKEEGEKRRGALSALMPPLETVRETARQQIARTPIRKLQPYAYFIAGQKASREAIKQIANEEYVGAALAKQRELLNMALYREASKAVEESESFAEHMRGLTKKSAQERLGKAGGDYLDQINELLERFEFTKIPQRRLDQRRSLAEWIKQKEIDGETMGEEFSVPESILNESKRVNYRELTYEEMVGLRDTVRQIEHYAALKNKLLKAQKQRDKHAAREALIAALENNLADKGPPPLTKNGLTLSEKASRLAQLFDASLLKMEQLVEWMDGGTTGPWHDYFWNPAADAQAAEYDATSRITAKVAEAVTNIPKEIRSKMLETVKIPGIDAVVTRKDLLGVALNLGNQGNYDKLLKGMGWTAEQVEAMKEQLTESEWKFVQSMWDTLESLWPEISALQKRLTGLTPEKVQARPIETRFGTYQGGYYPIMYSAVLSDQGQLQLASNIGKMLDDGYTRATLPSGYRKARVEGFSRPFDLDVDRLPNHIAGVVKDLTHREWLIDANWIANDPEIRAVLQRRMGDALTMRMGEWVKQVVNDRNSYSVASLDGWKRAVEHLRFNSMIVSMGFKASTLLSQLAGVAPAIEVVGGKDHDGVKWFAKGVNEVLRRPRSAYEFMTEKSGEMRHRIETRDRDIRDNLRRLEGRSDIRAQVQEFSMLGIGYMELMVSMPSWFGAYYKAIEAGMSDADAVRMGDRSVRLGQGAAGAKDLAAVATRSDTFMRLMTMFYTPFSALYGRLRAVGHDVGGIGDAPQAAARLFWIVIVAATLGELAAGHGPDKKKDEGWLHWWLKTVGSYPFLSIPLMRDVMNAITSQYGYQFTPITQALKTPAEAVDTGVKLWKGEKEFGDFADKAFKTMSYLVGLPTGQLQITGTYLYDLATGKAHPDNIFEFAKGMLYKRTKEEREQ